MCIFIFIYLFFRLRTKWSDALSNRREFLDTEVRKIMEKRSRNESDTVKENELIDQWTMLQVIVEEERGREGGRGIQREGDEKEGEEGGRKEIEERE